MRLGVVLLIFCSAAFSHPCESCHPKEVKGYAQTGMGRSLHTARSEPDGAATAYDAAPAQLLERLTRIALADPGTELIDCGTDCDRTARFVQRSHIMRFPDTSSALRTGR